MRKTPGVTLAIIALLLASASLLLLSTKDADGSRPRKPGAPSLLTNEIVYGTTNSEWVFTADDGTSASIVRTIEVVDSESYPTVINLCRPGDTVASTYFLRRIVHAVEDIAGTGTFDEWVIRAPVKINFRVKLFGEHVVPIVPVMC